MLNRKESSDLAAMLQAMVSMDLVVQVVARPGFARIDVDRNGGGETHLFSVPGQTVAEVMEAVVPQVNALDRKRLPEPTAATQAYAEALTAFGWDGKLFLAMDVAGNVVLYGEDRQPAAFRQRAAAARNGRSGGAIALWEPATGYVEWLVAP